MYDKIQKLLVLQRNDTEYIAVQRRLKTGPEDMIKAKANLVKIQALVDKKTAEVRKEQIATDAEEMEIKQSEEEIEKQKEKLNVVKNNKEYTIVRAAIAAADERKTEHETIELQLLEGLDKLQAELKVLEKKRATAATELDKFKVEFVEEEKNLLAKTDELRIKRKRCMENIEADDLAIYEAALRRNQGVAMALIKNGACQGCYSQPIRNVQNLVLLNRQLVSCSGCGRILYIADKEVVAE